MPYNGFEIDMLSLGDADSILLTQWEGGRPTYVLIDGGWPHDAPAVTAFLKSRKIGHIHHLVCSHIHDDHAGGLLRILRQGQFTFGEAWVHRPEEHVDMREVQRVLRKTASLKEARIITNSLKTEHDIVAELVDQGVEVRQPFRGEQIGFLTVCGPTKEYYAELVQTFRSADSIRQIHEELEEQETASFIRNFFERKAAAAPEVLLPSPKTEPENRSSTILGMPYNGKVFLFTADAGAESLEQVKVYKELGKCYWMQIPHHGSINNITQDLVDFFSPTIAYVSSEGNEQHPHEAVMDAFKGAGASVYGTHYPRNGHLHFSLGEVPWRSGYIPAEPL